MRRRRHSKVPPPAKPEPKAKPYPLAYRLKTIDDIEDSVLKNLMSELDKAAEQRTDYFNTLMNPGRRLEDPHQAMRVAIILATVALEGGNCTRAAKRLRILPQTVRGVVQQHRETIPRTPEIVQKQIRHQEAVETITQQAVESITESFWEGTDFGVRDLVNRIKEGKIATRDLCAIVKMMSERALVLAGQPTSRTAKSAERTLSDNQLEEIIRQNQEILSQIQSERHLRAG